MKNLKNFALFEARISRSSMFSKGFLAKFPNLSHLIYEECKGEANKLGGSVLIDYATKGDSDYIVIKVEGAEDIILGILSIKEPESRLPKWEFVWDTVVEIGCDDLVAGLNADSESIHRSLNSISPDFSSRPGEYLDILAGELFGYPVQFYSAERWLNAKQIADMVKKNLQNAWPDLDKMKDFIYSQGRRGKESIMDGMGNSFFRNYLDRVLQLLNEAKLRAAKTGRIMSDLDVSDVFKSDIWRNLEEAGWTNASTDRMLKNKSIVIQNSGIGLDGGISGAISIVNSGYVRKVYPSGSGIGNVVLKKFAPFVTLEDYYKALEYVLEYTFKKILGDVGIKIGAKKVSSMEDVAAHVANFYKEGNLEALSKSWIALPQTVKDRAIEISGDPDLEKMIRTFSAYRSKII
jgi:hypothetical protein